MKTKDHVFSNKDITVTYNPTVCTNAERCALELSNVFRQCVIPWIDLEADSNENIINQIKKCPSGALQFHLNKKEAC
ncbi:(4Fe-4S)-binding protein [Bizionia psychrotolerans]|uniref:(4Fe-4S)-binding protein n=1 Tax=Bizionia psychrotolerans TaxID=1492901 RepID=UPI0006513210|nr:(4Fe-4S)-binding protein [Bizionia psychrotolerans]